MGIVFFWSFAMACSNVQSIITSICSAGLLLVLVGCDSPKPSGGKSTGSSDGLPAYCAEYTAPAAAFRLASDQDATYDSKVKVILNTKCATARCHAAGATAPDLSTFAAAKVAGPDIVQRAITEKDAATKMPAAAALDAVSIDMIQTWVNKGYPQTYLAPPVTPPAPPPAAAAPTYADISALMTVKTCVTCHSTAGHSGSTILDTEVAYKEKAAKVTEKLQAVHYGQSFDAAQLKLTADYAAALVAAPPPAEEKKEEETGATADETKKEIPPECVVPEKGVETADAAPSETDAGAYDKVLKPAKLTECHEQNLLYDRRTKDCHVAALGTTFKCDWAGVKAGFKDFAPEETLQKLEDEKWQVDQCGTQDGNPVIFLILAETSDGFLNLSIKVLGLE
jgi:hypothetical protein